VTQILFTLELGNKSIEIRFGDIKKISANSYSVKYSSEIPLSRLKKLESKENQYFIKRELLKAMCILHVNTNLPGSFAGGIEEVEMTYDDNRIYLKTIGGRKNA